jgi:hypothetical protein
VPRACLDISGARAALDRIERGRERVNKLRADRAAASRCVECNAPALARRSGARSRGSSSLRLLPSTRTAVVVREAPGVTRDEREGRVMKKQPTRERSYSVGLPHRDFAIDYRSQALAALDLAAERRARKRAEFEEWISSNDEPAQEIARP